MKLKAKIIIVISAIMVLVIASIATVFLLSDGEQIKITFPENYVVIEEDTVSENAEYIELLGFTEDSFKNFLKSNNLKYFAANESNSMQFTLSSYSTQLSEQIETLGGRSEENLQSLVGKLELSGYNGTVIKTKSGDNFYELVYAATGDSPYISLQYVTLKNGNYYVLNYYGSAAELTDEEYSQVRETLDSLKIAENKGLLSTVRESGATGIVYAVISGIMIVLGVIVAVLLTVSIVRDIRLKKHKDDSGESFKIRRKRRYR